MAIEGTRSSIKERSALIWSEHCSECAMPDCFTSCEFYSPRADLKCQRFRGGITPVFSESQLLQESMFVSFKKWGKLEATATAILTSSWSQRVLEFIYKHFEHALNIIPAPYFFKLKIVRLIKRIMEKISSIGRRVADAEDGLVFLLEAVNHESKDLYFKFTVREFEERTRSFQKKINLQVGYSKTVINISEFNNVSLNKKCLYQLEPDESSQEVNVTFGMLDFVTLNEKYIDSNETTYKKVKAVVWDLDNTVWDGTLVEDGLDGLVLRPKVVSTIIKLDEMGILNSVASKNNFDDAQIALKRFGLEKYFLYPQVSWNPKSSGIKQIQKSLNVGMDTIIFIDDQIFERSEVSATLHEIRVFSDLEVDGLLNLPEFQLPVTDESRKRRKMYQENQVREHALADAGSDYTEFLKSCDLTITLSKINSQTLNRVHELSQRTNQMNFSGSRYTKSQLADLIEDDSKKTFVISCEDRFGDYGIVGFAIVDDSKQNLNDLMFSCRIQAKQVEHTFIRHLFELYIHRGKKFFTATYRPTKNNAQSGKVFNDVGFIVLGHDEGVQTLQFDLERYEAGDRVITVIDKT
ncbi:MAG: HAD-IIIC family phosphatase [Gammaproteobacteria bacterium]